jgi:secreted trypsin-like serine protease
MKHAVKKTKKITCSVCGYNGKKITRVRGGQEADKKDWPWMAVLLRRDDFFHYCGGVLITRRHVLTAAHCVHR